MKINGNPDGGGGGGGLILTLDAYSNGTYIPEAGVDGYSPVNVEVPISGNIGQITISSNGTYRALDEHLDGWEKVYVDVPSGDGTWSRPYDIMEAMKVIDAHPNGTSSMYVRGFVNNVFSAFSQTGNYGNAYFWVCPILSSVAWTPLSAYRLLYFDNQKYNDVSVPEGVYKPDVQFGDEVIMYGAFRKYNNSYQTIQNQTYLYAINNQYGIMPDPSLALEIASNGVYDVMYYGSVNVDTPVGYTEKEITERKYSIESLNNSASYVGTYAFYRNPDTIKAVDLPNCTRVEAYAFYNNFSISQLSLPVCSSIGTQAFVACSSLSELYLPACLNIESQAFNNCAGLQRVDLPVCNVIGSTAFKDCSLLTDVSLPNCELIYNQAFMSCYSLSQISLPVCSLIYSSAFNNCSNLQSLTLATESYQIPNYNNGILYRTKIDSGEGNIYVASDMYSRWIVKTGWSSLSSLFVSVEQSLPVLSYSDGLVYGLTRSTGTRVNFLNYLSISISELVRLSLPCISALSSVFYQATNLVDVDLTTCKIIGSLAFQNCYSLSQVNLPVCETLYNQAFENCSSLEYIDLPACKTIGNIAFSNCISLSQVSLPACELVDYNAFEFCSSLERISLPVCSYIGNNAFRSCLSLSEAYLPVCSYIGNNAFYIYKQDSFSLTLGYDGIVEAANQQPVYGYSNLYIYVPSSLVDAYKEAPVWSNFSSRIFPIS